jgi:hypothetical protein
MNKVATF